MGYIKNHLMKGEVVVYEAKLHGIVYFFPCVVALLSVVLCAVLPEDAMFVFALVILAFCAIWCVCIHGGRQYILTSKRVIAKEGIIRRNVNELMLRKCEGIHVKQSVSGRIFNYGTVLVTTGEATNRYRMIKDPLTFSTRINEQIEELKGEL